MFCLILIEISSSLRAIFTFKLPTSDSNMSSNNLSNRQKKSQANSNLKASIVHKPFDTGTVNIFNPHRSKNKAENQLSAPKLFLNAELEQTLEPPTAGFNLDPEPNEIEYRDKNWLDNLLSPWGISAIAILLLVNLISGGFIWRNARNAVKPVETNPVSIGNSNLTEAEFTPLTLGKLGTIKTVEDEVEATLDLTPIAPELAPIDDVASLSALNPKYHYILTEYTGEPSLSLARQKVKQVSLVNLPQGMFIYLGAFKEREDAEEFVSQLQEFSANVYPLGRW